MRVVVMSRVLMELLCRWVMSDPTVHTLTAGTNVIEDVLCDVACAENEG